MGAWGLGPFDNDGAWDFLDELAEGEPHRVSAQLTIALSAVVDAEECIDSGEADAAAVAAALIAARFEDAVVDQEVGEVLAACSFEVTAELRALARRALERLSVPEDNEWYALWRESGAIDKVLDHLRPYLRNLSGTASGGPTL